MNITHFGVVRSELHCTVPWSASSSMTLCCVYDINFRVATHKVLATRCVFFFSHSHTGKFSSKGIRFGLDYDEEEGDSS